MPLDLRRDAQERTAVERVAQERVRGDHAADDRGRARSEAASDRDRGTLHDVVGPEVLLRGPSSRAGTNDEQIFFIGRYAAPVAFDRHGPRTRGTDLVFGKEWRARAKESKPGPRFALDAGTRTRSSPTLSAQRTADRIRCGLDLGDRAGERARAFRV